MKNKIEKKIKCIALILAFIIFGNKPIVNAQIKFELKSGLNKSSSNTQTNSTTGKTKTNVTNSDQNKENSVSEKQDDCKNKVSIKENEFDNIKYFMTPMKEFASQYYTAKLIVEQKTGKPEDLYIALRISVVEIYGNKKASEFNLKTSKLLLLFEDGTKYELALRNGTDPNYFSGGIYPHYIQLEGANVASKSEQERIYTPEFSFTKEQLGEFSTKVLKKFRLVFDEINSMENFPYNHPPYCESKFFFTNYGSCLLNTVETKL